MIASHLLLDPAPDRIDPALELHAKMKPTAQKNPSQGRQGRIRQAAGRHSYFKGESELFARSKHLPELTETITQLAQEKIARLNAEYEAALLKFLRDLVKMPGFAGPPPGLTFAQMVRLIVRAAMAAKHEAVTTGDWESFYRQLRQLSAFGIAALRA
jgi:hypothetical protein